MLEKPGNHERTNAVPFMPPGAAMGIGPVAVGGASGEITSPAPPADEIATPAVEAPQISNAEQADLQARQEYNQAVADVLQTTDWDAVVQKHIVSAGHSGLRLHLSTMTQHVDGDATETAGFTRIVQQLGTIIERSGDRKPESLPEAASDGQNIPPTPEEAERMLDTLRRSGAGTKADMTSLGDDRYKFLQAQPAFAQLQNIGYLDEVMTVQTEDEPLRIVPPEIVAAMDNHTRRCIDELHQADREYLAQGAETPAPEIVVQGGELLQDMLGIDDAAIWARQRIARFPTPMTRGLGGVSFVRASPDALRAHGKVPGDTGYYDPATGNIVCFISETQIAELEQARAYGDTDAEQRARLAIRQELERTEDHEIGHHAFTHLSLSEMATWRGEVTNDPRLPFEADNTEEAFAWALESFMNEPWTEHTANPNRFQRMNDRVARYTDEDLVRGEMFMRLPGMSTNITKSTDHALRARADRRVRDRNANQ